jgi:hypothetical protein
MGNPFVHLDLATTDVAAARKFYGSVFDWKFQDVPDMNWTGIDVGTGVGGGMGPKNMPEQPTAWTAYVEVSDVAATLAKAQANGAQIIVPEMAVGEMGKLGVFIDPQGATCGVWAPMKAPPAPPAAKKKPAAAAKKKPAPKKKAAAPAKKKKKK